VTCCDLVCSVMSPSLTFSSIYPLSSLSLILSTHSITHLILFSFSFHFSHLFVSLCLTSLRMTSLHHILQIDENDRFTEFFKHLSALLNKRRLYFMRDTRSWIFQYVVPVLFVLIGMLVMRVRTDPTFYFPLN
jgi:hypothetical protein